MKNIYQKIRQFDLAQIIRRRIEKADGIFWHAFFASFIALNLIFLYHGAIFLFGDHDWKYLKDGIPLDVGLFEGRFSQFIAVNLLSRGEILPILNNLIGIGGFCFGIALLARYWHLPHKNSTYIIFALFSAVTPYILSFMYFAFLIIPVLSWNAFIIGALIISEKETTFSLKKTLLSITLITLALGGYPPVINLLGVALITRWLIAVLYEKAHLTDLIKSYRWSLINITLSAITYKIILYLITLTGKLNSSYYNLQTTPINKWPEQLLRLSKDFFIEFWATLPFITIDYKLTAIVITVLALGIIIKSKQKTTGIVLCASIFFAGLATLFLSTSVKETEFSPRIDFFGFMYGISAMYAVISKSNSKTIKNLASTAAMISIFISTNNLFEAQKVWKLGFNAEMMIYKRIIKRFEQAPLFNPLNRYIVVQGGSPAFREKYYHEKYSYQSDDLLGISYVPGMASGVMWNYYGPRDYTDSTSYVYTFSAKEDFKQALREAAPWPKEESIKVGGYWILLSLTPAGLNYLKQHYLP